MEKVRIGVWVGVWVGVWGSVLHHHRVRARASIKPPRRTHNWPSLTCRTSATDEPLIHKSNRARGSIRHECGGGDHAKVPSRAPFNATARRDSNAVRVSSPVRYYGPGYPCCERSPKHVKHSPPVRRPWDVRRAVRVYGGGREWCEAARTKFHRYRAKRPRLSEWPNGKCNVSL